MHGFEFGMSFLAIILVFIVADLVEEYKYGQDV